MNENDTLFWMLTVKEQPRFHNFMNLVNMKFIGENTPCFLAISYIQNALDDN